MLLKYFRSNDLSLFFINPILLLLAWIPSFAGSALTGNPANVTGILDSYFLEFTGSFPLVSTIVAVSIIAVNALLIVELNAQHFFIPVRGLMPGMLYALICSAFPLLSHLTPALVASTFIILVLYRVLVTFRQEGLSYNYFEAGILLSVAGILYLPALIFYPVLLIILAILRQYQWREWAFTLAGLAVPFIFLFSYYYLADKSVAGLFSGVMDSLSQTGKEELSLLHMVFLITTGVVILVGSFYIFRIIGLMKIQSRKYFLIFFWIFVLSIVIYAIIPAVSREIIYFMAIPVAFLAGNYFMQCRPSWLNNLLFLLLAASVYALRYLHL
jgi:hypothetical protein